MVESNKSQSEYGSMSPRERNMEFKRLVNSFPRFYVPTTVEEFEEILGPGRRTMSNEQRSKALLAWMKENIRRRKDSEYKEIVLQKISSLLEYAPVTGPFRTFLERNLDSVFSVGLPRYWGREEIEDQPTREPIRLLPWEPDVLGILLDVNNHDSGGIFDPKRAEHLERVFYSVVRAYNIDFHGGGPKGWLMDKVDAFISIKIGRRVLPDLEDDQQLLDRWGKEFRARYGKRLKPLPLPELS